MAMHLAISMSSQNLVLGKAILMMDESRSMRA